MGYAESVVSTPIDVTTQSLVFENEQPYDTQHTEQFSSIRHLRGERVIVDGNLKIRALPANLAPANHLAPVPAFAQGRSPHAQDGRRGRSILSAYHNSKGD